MVTHTLSVRILGQSSERNIHVDKSSRFRQLKDLIVDNLVKSGSIQRQDVIFCSIFVVISSFTHDERLRIIPHDQDYIVEYLDRIANVKLGSCQICFDDIRSPLTLKTSNLIQGPLDLSNGIVWIGKNFDSQFTAHYTSSWMESLFWNVSSCAIMQGEVERKISIGRKQDQFRDYWAILTKMTLWLFPITSLESDDANSFGIPLLLELGTETCLVEIQDQTTLVFSYREFIHNDTDVSKQILMSKYTKKREVIRVKTSHEAQNWITALHNHSSSDNENSIFHDLETDIAIYNFEESKQVFTQLNSYEKLINFLKQSSLRGSFKKFLEAKGKLDIIKFWEYAEDFRINFSGDGQAMVKNSERRNHLQMWIDKIYQLQLEVENCLQCSFPKRIAIENIEADVFFEAQKIAWKTLLELFSVFKCSVDFNRIILQVLNEKANGVNNSASVSSANTAPKATSLRPLSTVFGWISGQTSKLSSKQDKNFDIKNSSALDPPQTAPFWRQTSIAFSIPDWWWDKLPESNRMEWSLDVTNQDVSSSVLSDGLPIESRKMEAEDLLTSSYNSVSKGAGKVVLVALFKCTLQFNNQTPKFRPLSLFGFGGGDDSLKTTGKDQNTSAKFDEDEPFSALSNHKRTDLVPELAGDGDTRTISNYGLNEEVYQTLTSVGVRQIVFLAENFGDRILYFVDPSSFCFNFSIKLEDLLFIGPSHKQLYSIDLVSNCLGGFTFTMLCDQSEDADQKLHSTQWLNTLSMLRPENVISVNIIKRGYLQKRGKVNTAFKWRWFELSSDLQLRYYKDDVSGGFKGSIDLSLLDPNDDSSFVSYIDKELVINMQKINRIWVLKAEDEKVGGEWVFLINDLINYSIRNQSIRTLNNQTELEEEDED